MKSNTSSFEQSRSSSEMGHEHHKHSHNHGDHSGLKKSKKVFSSILKHLAPEVSTTNAYIIASRAH